MTRDDVLNAAFRVWGQELYKTTSLSKLAKNLGVSKPALYRHFPDKQSLLDAMKERFYDNYADAIKPVIEEEVLKSSSPQKKHLAIVQFIAAYFARHFDYFIYSLNRFHENDPHFFHIEEMNKRGIYFAKLGFQDSSDHPSALLLAGITAFLGIAMFHKRRHGIEDTVLRNMEQLDESWFLEAPKDEIDHFSAALAERIRLGLLFDRRVVDSLPYEKLETSDAGIYAPPEPLLKAAAEVIAEEGPWNTSMETVAKRSGLSKSGLYAHFKSKNAMLSRLFMTEFECIAQCAAARTAQAKTREERLYLAILSIADYFLDRPEILIMMDWLRIQRLELDFSIPGVLFDVFSGLKLTCSAEDQQCRYALQHDKGSPQDISSEGIFDNISHWVLFLLVAVLMKDCCQRAVDVKPPISAENKPEKLNRSSLRKMFRFISLGLEGINCSVYSPAPAD